MYSVETCGVCKHERMCAYDFPCDECSVLRSCCKESYFEEAEKDEDDVGWVVGKRGIYCDD